jgi:hypothetical protein
VDALTKIQSSSSLSGAGRLTLRAEENDGNDFGARAWRRLLTHQLKARSLLTCISTNNTSAQRILLQSGRQRVCQCRTHGRYGRRKCHAIHDSGHAPGGVPRSTQRTRFSGMVPAVVCTWPGHLLKLVQDEMTVYNLITRHAVVPAGSAGVPPLAL